MQESSDEDINIEDDLSPKKSDSKKISMLQKGCHNARDWRRCGDAFVNLTTFKHNRKKKNAQNVSLVSEHRDFEKSIGKLYNLLKQLITAYCDHNPHQFHFFFFSIYVHELSIFVKPASLNF